MTEKSDGQHAFDLLQDAIDRVSTYDTVYLRSYSGRAMYGQECIAITGEGSDLLKVVIKAAVLNNDMFEDLDMADISQDSMGLGEVWYWRHIEPIGVVFEEDEDEDY